MSTDRERRLEELLERLRRGEQVWDPEFDRELRAARWLNDRRPTPSPTFVQELEAHLREYAASSARNRQRGKKAGASTPRGLHLVGRRDRDWKVTLRFIGAGLGLLALLIGIVALVTPAGRTTARDVGGFIGIVQKPDASESTAGAPPLLEELEEEVGFEILLPSYVPEGLRLSEIQKLSDPTNGSGVEITYTSSGESPFAVLSVFELKASPEGDLFQVEGEVISVEGKQGSIRQIDGPIEQYVLSWVDSGIFFELRSAFAVDELLKIAESFE
jgi:hypothetical protein